LRFREKRFIHKIKVLNHETIKFRKDYQFNSIQITRIRSELKRNIRKQEFVLGEIRTINGRCSHIRFEFQKIRSKITFHERKYETFINTYEVESESSIRKRFFRKHKVHHRIHKIHFRKHKIHHRKHKIHFRKHKIHKRKIIIITKKFYKIKKHFKKNY